MQAVSSTTTNAATSDPVTVTTPTDSTKSTTSTPTSFDLHSILSSDFSTVLKSSLGGDAKPQVNEEELFSALVEQQLSGVSQDAANTFSSEKDKLMSSMARADGYVPIEDVTYAALNATVSAGAVDSDVANQIRANAFRGAQLDDNLDTLWDSRGSATDNTIAVDSIDSAIEKASTTMEKIASGELTVDPSAGSAGSASGSTTSSAAADGSGGFLWKPVSDSDGNLVVLLPSELNGNIASVEIHSDLPPTEENKLDTGKFSGVANGDRSHFRFSKPGADYGPNVHVVVTKDDGSAVTYDIADGSQRID